MRTPSEDRDWPGAAPRVPGEGEFEEALRLRARGEIEELEKYAGVNAPLCLTTGEVAGTVRDEVRRHAADLIVIGRGVLNETLGRMRTHTYGIIREAPCPVISV